MKLYVLQLNKKKKKKKNQLRFLNSNNLRHWSDTDAQSVSGNSSIVDLRLSFLYLTAKFLLCLMVKR